MVMLVSAMLVARTTFRTPGGGEQKTRFWSALFTDNCYYSYDAQPIKAYFITVLS